MMINAAEQLATLQYADSFFPSGAASFSNGLESLVNEQAICDASDLQAFVMGQLSGRWAGFERPAVVACHRAEGDLGAVATVDRLLEAQTLAAEQRQGSRNIGAALLALHVRLGTIGAEAYHNQVNVGNAIGHAAAVQGLLWHACGVSQAAAETISAHQLLVGLLSAGLRLGVVGHIDCQKIISAARPLLTQLLAEPALPVTSMRAFTPQAEIAVMRHETSSVRLFAS